MINSKGRRLDTVSSSPSWCRRQLTTLAHNRQYPPAADRRYSTPIRSGSGFINPRLRGRRHVLDLDAAFLPYKPAPALVFLPPVVSLAAVESSPAASTQRHGFTPGFSNCLEFVAVAHLGLPCLKPGYAAGQCLTNDEHPHSGISFMPPPNITTAGSRPSRGSPPSATCAASSRSSASTGRALSSASAVLVGCHVGRAERASRGVGFQRWSGPGSAAYPAESALSRIER